MRKGDSPHMCTRTNVHGHTRTSESTHTYTQYKWIKLSHFSNLAVTNMTVRVSMLCHQMTSLPFRYLPIRLVGHVKRCICSSLKNWSYDLPSDLHKGMKPHPGTHQREVIAHMHTHTHLHAYTVLHKSLTFQQLPHLN